MAKLSVIFFIIVALVHGFAENINAGDLSRFQYDHEMTKKIVEIEHEHEVMKYLLTRYQRLEDTNVETAKILESQEHLIRSLQANIKEMDTKLDAQDAAIKSINDSLRAGFENQEGEIGDLRTKYGNITAEGSNRGYDCREILARNQSAQSGIYTIQIQRYFAAKFHTLLASPTISVYCDMATQNGGWIVFQRRKDGSEVFNHGWTEYKNGFGKLDGEFWLGLENIHALVVEGKWELLINMKDNSAGTKYALYEKFYVGSEGSGYVLDVGKYKGDAEDKLTHSNGMKFSTKDKDNDRGSSNCAAAYQGGWWYVNCGADWSLNRPYGQISWRGFSTSIEFVEMKMRRIG